MNQQNERKEAIRKVEVRRWDKAIAPNHNHHTVTPIEWGARKVEAQRWDKAIAPNHNHHTVPPIEWN